MTDLEALYQYRIKQAEETLEDAKNMYRNGQTAKSVVNRAYYAVFYSLLSLFIKTKMNVKTSKHIGVIAVFDKEFVRSKKIDKKYSEIVHKLFEMRQEGDYMEFAEITREDAKSSLSNSEDFLQAIKIFKV